MNQYCFHSKFVLYSSFLLTQKTICLLQTSYPSSHCGCSNTFWDFSHYSITLLSSFFSNNDLTSQIIIRSPFSLICLYIKHFLNYLFPSSFVRKVSSALVNLLQVPTFNCFHSLSKPCGIIEFVCIFKLSHLDWIF